MGAVPHSLLMFWWVCSPAPIPLAQSPIRRLLVVLSLSPPTQSITRWRLYADSHAAQHAGWEVWTTGRSAWTTGDGVVRPSHPISAPGGKCVFLVYSVDCSRCVPHQRVVRWPVRCAAGGVVCQGVDAQSSSQRSPPLTLRRLLDSVHTSTEYTRFPAHRIVENMMENAWPCSISDRCVHPRLLLVEVD